MGQKSQVKGFNKGLVTDSDPRLQLDGTYRDAMNIKIINVDGSTFTVENINGNRKLIDLTDTEIFGKSDYLYNGNPVTTPFQYNYFTPRTDASGNVIGPYGVGSYDGTTVTPGGLKGAANIVGHFSFKNQLFLIVCGYIGYNENGGSNFIDDFRTIFFLLDFNSDGEVIKTTELRVCYNHLGNEFPNINMDPNIKCRVEGITENDCISRVYWTDNKNPLRTLNIRGKNLENLNPDELDITPKCDHSQIVLKNVISGSLPVGVYQYCYKYLTDAGAETGISPQSNLYHISNTDSTSYQTYSGGEPGAISSDGFELQIDDLDTDFDEVQIYALFYNNLNVPPQVTEVTKKSIPSNGIVNFKHTTLTEVIQDGLEKILIPSNTWDICKDIAIKDNVLFAANLRQKRNYISEKEWNVKVRRFDLDSHGDTSVAGSLTTNDSNVKEYYAPSSEFSQQTLDESTVIEISGGANYIKLNKLGTNHHQAHRYLRGGYDIKWGNDQWNNDDGAVGSRRVLGAESYGYYGDTDESNNSNGLGGCLVSFRQVPKVSDTIDNRGGINNGSSPFISTSIKNDSFQTDNVWKPGGSPDYESSEDNTTTEYVATLNIGSNKDPMASGSKRGYQRGETYRFGVLVYDLNGDPGNVLWIGDIQMPQHYDKAWELDINFGPDNDGTIAGIGRDFSSSATRFKENPDVQDYRISANGSASVPACGTIYDKTSCIAGTDDSDSGSQIQSGNAKTTRFVPKDREGQHLTFDLALDFTFKIPSHVLKKISGFQVVRAERTETDRTIVQSGLINEVSRYDGYGKGAANVQANDTEYIVDENVDQIYDQVLKGYLGLSETSHRCVGFNTTDNKPLYLNESDASTSANFMSGSSYFGIYSNGRYAIQDTDIFGQHVHTMGNVHLMYSPDSTFGIRPYLSRAEDDVQIVSVMKLYDQRRYDNDVLQKHTTSNAESMGHGQTTYNQSSAYATQASDYPLYFSTKKTTRNDESGVLVGKCYVFDPYFPMYCGHNSNNSANSRHAYLYGPSGQASVSGNYQYVHQPATSTFFDMADPYVSAFSPSSLVSMTNTDLNQTKNVVPFAPWYSRKILRAKEIVDGEIVSKGFFDSITLQHSGLHYVWNSGFSNFTLGFIGHYGSHSWGNYLSYAKIHEDLDASDVSYDTISTLQMGTRAILIQSHYEGGYDKLCGKDIDFIIENQDYLATKDAKRYISANSTDCLHRGTKIPFYYYANIYRTNDNQYGGNSIDALEKTRWIAAGNKHQLREGHGDLNGHHHTTVFGGDTFVGMYSHQMTTSPYPEKSYSKWIVFPCESFVNTEMRSGYHLGANNHIEGFDQTAPPFSNDWFYNPVYSQENNTKSYLSVKRKDCEYTDLPYEVAYSKTKLAGEESDAFRVFPIFNFYDVEAIHGGINRLVNFNNEIYFVQENAFGQLLVNPRTFLSDAAGGQTLFTGSGDTIESHQYISVKYGTQHMHSVVVSESGLYYFDSRYAKLLKFDTAKQFTVLSDEIGCRDLFKKAIEYGRLTTREKYLKAPRVNLGDMPLYFIGIHGGFDYQNNTVYYTFSDRLRIDKYDREKYPEGRYVLNRKRIDPSNGTISYQTVGRNVLNLSDIGSINAQYPEGTGNGGFAERSFYSTTIGISEDLNAVVSKYSVYPQQWIEHQGSLITPKARSPFITLSTGGVYQAGLFDSNPTNNPTFVTAGSGCSGVYGHNENYYFNPSKYIRGVYELAEGPLQLYKWDDIFTPKLTFFDDVQIHPKNNASVAVIDYQNISGFVGQLEISAIDGNGIITSINVIDPGTNYASGTYDIEDSLGNVVATIDSVDGLLDASTINITSTDSYTLGDAITIVSPTDSRVPVIDAAYLEKVINEAPGDNKKFDNFASVMTVGDINNVYYGTDNNNVDRNKATNNSNIASQDIGRYIEKIEFVTDFSDIGLMNVSTSSNPYYQTNMSFNDRLHKYREGVLRAPLRNLYSVDKNPRLTGTYLRVKLTARTQEKFNIFAIMAKYRKSFN